MSAAIIAELDSALRAGASEELAQSLQRYFPTPVRALGVSNACVTKIAAQAFAQHRTLSGDDWLALAEHFARSQAYHEHFMLASALATNLAPRLDDGGRLLKRVQAWFENAVGNWAQCDDLCIKPLYGYLRRHPHLMERIYPWGESQSPWCRRASNVALVKFVGRNPHVDLDRVFANCARLLGDRDPYVQKGIGWVLKVAGKYEPALVVAFLRGHLASMERATLRYAIGDLPADAQRIFVRG